MSHALGFMGLPSSPGYSIHVPYEYNYAQTHVQVKPLHHQQAPSPGQPHNSWLPNQQQNSNKQKGDDRAPAERNIFPLLLLLPFLYYENAATAWSFVVPEIFEKSLNILNVSDVENALLTLAFAVVDLQALSKGELKLANDYRGRYNLEVLDTIKKSIGISEAARVIPVLLASSRT